MKAPLSKAFVVLLLLSCGKSAEAPPPPGPRSAGEEQQEGGKGGGSAGHAATTLQAEAPEEPVDGGELGSAAPAPSPRPSGAKAEADMDAPPVVPDSTSEPRKAKYRAGNGGAVEELTQGATPRQGPPLAKKGDEAAAAGLMGPRDRARADPRTLALAGLRNPNGGDSDGDEVADEANMAAEESKKEVAADALDDAPAAQRGEASPAGAPDAESPARRAHTVRLTGEDPALFLPPDKTLPRMFYFENTYLGGSAAYAERLRRLDQSLAGESRPYEVVQAEVQPFDAPRTEGLGLTASIDATHFERARRVFLQVGLRGSARYGWRRPPLDIVLVIDQPAFLRGPTFVTGFVVDLLRQLGPSDRLGIVLAGENAPTFLDLARLGTAQQHLANRIDALTAPRPAGEGDLADAMRKAGRILDQASDEEATVPGTRTLLVLSGEHDQSRIGQAAGAAHVLTVEGCVTSVFALDAEQSEWWQVADAGYGNLHRITAAAFAPALEEEMQSLARVVARLVRVNVRLGKEATAIRVLGTRVLEQREVEEVKARERATDINLSKSLGITSDRGEDDDGIQTVIPYFYGDDSHVILIELWVAGPGPIADVTLRYKDMVNLDNATARTSVRLGTRPQPSTQEQILIARNVRGFELAENLQRASDAVYSNDLGRAVKNLGAASSMAGETNALDVQAIQGLKAMVEQSDWQNDANRRATLQEMLLISGQRRVGDTGKSSRK